MPCHTGGGGSGAGFGSAAGGVRMISRIRSGSHRRTLGSVLVSVGVGDSVSVEKNSRLFTTAARTSSLRASDTRAFQIARPRNVNSTSSPRSRNDTSPPVFRMRITTKLSRPTSFATEISSWSVCPSASSSSCRSTSRPILESLCTR
jgi:hypothetical protein